MPSVDLSMIGLDGIKFHNDQMLTQQQTRVQKTVADNNEIENAAAARDAQLDQSVAGIFSNIAQGNTATAPSVDDTGGDSRADALVQAGDLMFRGGSTKRGQEFYDAAAKMREAEQKLTNDKITAQQNKLENQLKSADLVYRMIGTAKNQSEYETGLQQLRASDALTPEEKQHLDSLPDEFDPQIARYLAGKAIEAKDQATIALSERARDQQDTNLRNTEAYRMDQLQIDRARLAEQRRMNAIKESEGKAATAPNDQELQSVQTIITNQLFKGSPPEKDSSNDISLKAGTQAVATRAKALVKENRSLDWNTAVQRALMESENNGDWNTVKKTNWHGGDDGTDTTFKPKNLGRTPDLALPMPIGADNKASKDPSKYKVGLYYITTKGRARWNGKQMEAVE